MNLKRLKYFVKIVDIGSLTQAAEVLYIAQPALSQQVANLEAELDQQLLIRTKRGVTPTEAGKVLYDHAKAILRQCEQAQLAVSSVGKALTLKGTVSIGLAPGAAASVVILPMLRSMRAGLPDVMIHLHENSNAELNHKLLNGELDMAIVYDSSAQEGLVSEPLLKENLFLVGSGICPGKTVDLNTIAEMNLFLPCGYSALRKRIDNAFTLRSLRTEVVGEIESTATLTAVVASGMGVTILPESAACALVAATQGWMAHITQPSLSLPLTLNLSSRQPLSAQSEAVKDSLLSLVSRPLPENALWMMAG